MKDSYSLDRNWEGLDQQYRNHYQAYFNIFHRSGLPVIAVKSDTGMMGGKLAHEFMYLSPTGEDTLLLCDACGYSANRQVARFQKTASPAEPALPIEKVPTPGTKTIESLAALLNIPESKTAKVVFMVATLPIDGGEEDRLVMAVVRGDMELNETKLVNALKARELRPAHEEEITAGGAVAGFASPVGLNKPLVVVDDLIPQSSNLVSGANETDYHLLNVNYGRDYQAQIVADLAAAQQGSPCPDCGKPMRAERGIEVGNIFKLGTRYSEAMGCQYVDENGDLHPIVMGSYGIGVGRLLACVAEEHNDEQGLKWPVSIAPFHVHLVLVPGKDDPRPAEVAEQLYQELTATGVEVLFDDRPESPGVKFNDADLIGLPLRLTVGQRSLKNGGVEFKRRDQEERSIVPVDSAVAAVKERLAELWQEIEQKVVEVPYEE